MSPEPMRAKSVEGQRVRRGEPRQAVDEWIERARVETRWLPPPPFEVVHCSLSTGGNAWRTSSARAC